MDLLCMGQTGQLQVLVISIPRLLIQQTRKTRSALTHEPECWRAH
jgi:hypothetical protein